MTGRKTTLDLDEELLGRARQVLGTRGIKETIDRALYEIVVADARRRTIAELRALEGNPDELRRAAWGV